MANLPGIGPQIITNDGSAPPGGITYLYGDAVTKGSMRFRIQVPETVQYLERLEVDPNDINSLIWVIKTTVENSLTTDQFYIDVAGGGLQFLSSNPALVNKSYGLVRSSHYDTREVIVGDYLGRTTIAKGLRKKLLVESPSTDESLSAPIFDNGEIYTTDFWSITFTQGQELIFYESIFTFANVPPNTYMRYSRSVTKDGQPFAESLSFVDWERDKTLGQLIHDGDNNVVIPLPIAGETGQPGYIQLEFSNVVDIEGEWLIPAGTTPGNPATPHDGGLFAAKGSSLSAPYDRLELSAKKLYTESLVGETIKIGSKYSDYEGIICIREHVGVYPVDIFDGNWQRIGDRTYLVFNGTTPEKDSRLVTSWLDGDTMLVVTTKPTNIDATYEPVWGDNGNGEGVVTVIDGERMTSFQATSTAPLPAHKAVYIFGNEPLLNIPDVAESDIDAAYSLPVAGITRDAIDSGVIGTVMTNGNIEGFNTSLWSVGDQLYIDTFGDLTNVKPASHNQVLAQVLKVGASDGIIKVGIKATVAPNAIKVLSAASFTSQTPTGTDTPLQIEFGGATGSPSDPVQLDALGAITINDTAMYQIDIYMSFVRYQANNQAEIFARALVNGIQNAPPTAIIATDDEMSIPIQINLRMELVATDVLTFEFYRDSSGHNSGHLESYTSSIGWGSSPSAMISILKF